ncbi:RhoGAP domain-containing protein [Encephalitozoon romaleae SJ-2008]|uniref:RhoGAP domain-containing protein n=1 Tax=Encephalitozoon romaleae (strain SJ-2008) TaxID=1178016 RepID=I6ZV96_ENCRO|nr:RhoGAP domain-containing protein [Encephalitozoon romaleae SJ-2008]AFN83646.1 RhoGAP domain-containing protein [Encephalitozoon romaleae SJ-2008]
MLRDFPKKRKIFNIAEMKEIEETHAKGDEPCSESNASPSVHPQPYSPRVILQPISESDHTPSNYLKNGSVQENIGGFRNSSARALYERLFSSTSIQRKKKLETAVFPSEKSEEELLEFRYEFLSSSQKIELSRFCWNAFRKRSTNTLFAWMNCFWKKSSIGRCRLINPMVFDVIESLKRRAVCTKFIFRYEPDKSEASRIANMVHEDKCVDIEGTNVLVLANALKNYIREHLDGLIPIEVFEKIKSCIISNDRHRKEALFSYMPFIFTDAERRLLVSLFELLRIIDENSDVTEMTIDSLLGLFSLVLHPQAAFTTLHDLDHAKTITREMYRLDFGAIPQGVVVHELVFV